MKKAVDPKVLCLQLLEADSQDAVMQILKTAGYWDDPNAWRYYGGKDGNWAQIGAQQARPEASLAEKITNSIDARLMGACQAAGIDPESATAPKSMASAVTTYFGSESGYGAGNCLTDWLDPKRLELSKGLTIAVTGERRHPSLSIADLGEGQRPDRIPDTIVSLDKRNKFKVHFVQGTFNMGGSGALPFCGENGFQLVISRRDPAVVSARGEGKYADAHQWGFTIVRREDTDGRSSAYTYLAPIDAVEKPRAGRILRFDAAELSLLPAGQKPYGRAVAHGSLVKLYEYSLPSGYTGNAVLPDGLRSLMEIRLPSPALPIRVHEYRAFRGHAGSFETSILGLTTRLDDNWADNVEKGFPDSVQFSVGGERLTARVYALKKGRLKTYVKNDGIILTVNGQTHAVLPNTFFTRKSVNMDRLATSILVMVDCSSLSQRARENLFMTSRDRLRDGTVAPQLIDQLEEIIGHHPGLKELRERRAREELEERLKDDQPLEKVLEKLFRTSPELVQLFGPGLRMGSPFKSGGTTTGTNGSGGRGETPFAGKPHPTYFRFDKRTYGQTLVRHFEAGRKCRLRLETDAVNEYFKRDDNPGMLVIETESESGVTEPNWSVTLHDGIAVVSLDFGDTVKPSDEFTVTITLLDGTTARPFVNVAKLTAQDNMPHERGGKRVPPNSKAKGQADDGPGGLAMPQILRVREDQWAEREFDQHSGAALIRETRDDKPSLTFYVNVDNAHLRQSQKTLRHDPKLSEARFVFGNVLIGLAVLQRFQQLEKRASPDGTGDAGDSPSSRLVAVGFNTLVREVTRATAPFLIPMIDRLGAMTEAEVESAEQVVDGEGD